MTPHGISWNIQLTNSKQSQFDMEFADLDGGNVLESFDFDSFLQDGQDELTFDSTMTFGATDGVEAGTGDS